MHPNVVTAFDAGVADGEHFIAMELIDGVDLARLVAEDGPLTVELAIDCIRQAAHSLSAAHEAGMIHRDVKPANLLRSRDGVVKVLDLGLAKVRQSLGDGAATQNLTRTGQLFGTIDYMAPEQALNVR